MNIFIIFIIVLLQNWDINGQESSDDLNLMAAAEMDTHFIEPSTAPVLYNEENTVRRPIGQDVKFYCKDPLNGELFEIRPANLTAGGRLSSDDPFMFIIHGWRSNGNTTAINDMLQDAIQYLPKMNFCVVDWRRLANYEYNIAATRNVYEVGNYTARIFQRWQLNLTSTILVGQSMGAHVAGEIGRKFNGQIGRIYGLDPAGPAFCHPTPVNNSLRLDGSDAKYVQIITTCAGQTGCALKSGDATFNPNGGVSPQPPCPIPQYEVPCSHRIATAYFRYSLNPDNRFVGEQCTASFFGFCLSYKRDLMGFWAEGIAGNYSLETGSAPPYTL